ncbi:GNAT family N-acetyltransferase [Bacillus capparidis]|nr:GNAT family N-acetyltransferase [Bacillus capparidis]MBP1082447.1 phosphinothricin acetyltransferase [Bacillus capparidis]MED1097305.1 GNAT family N-acetyltransferase [Bacillus capparidis]
MQNTLTVRTMKEEDWEAVQTIYIKGIETGNATFETEAPSWEKWDIDHLQFGRLVALQGNQIVGWVALSPYSSRPVYRGVAGVSIYIDPEFSGKKVGSSLMKNLIEECEKEGFWTLQSGIFPENQASLSLHQKFGFREVGRREKIGKLDGKWRDVLLLEKKLPSK